MASLGSASVSSAADCVSDPNECTLKKLCEAATTLDGSNTIWATTSETAKHVALAQSLGMECGVTPIVDLCETDPSECKVSEICEKATTESAGQKTWDDSAAGHVALAKEFGLSCDVVIEAKTEAQAVCNLSDVAGCNAKILCTNSTYYKGKTKTWSMGYRLPYVEEAKKRGLTCGVGEITSSKKSCVVNPENCEEEQLCRLGTLGPSNKKRWSEEGKDYAIEAKKRRLTCGVSGSDTSTFSGTCTAQGAAGCTNEELCYYAESSMQHYAKEAKKRGLTCGVGEAKATSVNKGCSASNVKGCSEVALCEEASFSGSNATVWFSASSPFVIEAKKRGLTCGVGTKATNFKKAFTSQSRLKRQQLQYALKKLGYYSYGIDGLWGKGTSSAFVKFVSGNGLTGSRESQVFSSLLAKVDVPSSFAAPKKKATASNNSGGWRSFSANPQYSFEQAKAICEPQAKNARDSAANPTTGSSFRCTSNGYTTNCRDNSGPSSVAAGILQGVAQGISKRKARERTMKSCMAQYGWTK